MTKKKSKPRAKKRQERRFIPQSSHSPWLVRVLGGAGAATLGAGAWANFYGHAFEGDEKLKAVPQYLIAGGAVLTGVAIWLGTSSDPPLRVGAPGIGMERGDVRRVPWWGLTELTWESGSLSLVVTGKDEAGASLTFKVPLKSHPEAVGWIVKEARDRVPKVVDIPEEVLEKLPAASPHAGLVVELEPLQVVGKKCAASGKTISYEPDARVCERCERVYFKRAVPKKCKCGASLGHLRAQSIQTEDAEDEGAEDEAAHEQEDAES